MRAFKVIGIFCAKQAELISFIVGFYLVFIFQYFTGITGSNISNLILIIFSATCGYAFYKLIVKIPVKKFEQEEDAKGKLAGLDRYIFILIMVLIVFVVFYFTPTGSDSDQFFRSR